MTSQAECRRFPTTPEIPNKRRLTTNADRLKVADGIIANAKSLVAVDWEEILPIHTSYIPRLGRYTGRDSVAHSIAPTVNSVVSRMGLNMDAPEIVYMSGYYFLRWSEIKLGTLNEIKEDTRTKITFVSDDARQTKLAQETEDTRKLENFRNKLSQSLDYFVDIQSFIQEFPSEGLETYLDILRFFLYPPDSYKRKGTNSKNIVYDLLKRGDIEGAARILGILPPKTNQ